MREDLKQLVVLFNDNIDIQEKIANQTWEGQRLFMIGNILAVFAYNPEIQSLVFDNRSYDSKPSNYLNASVNFYPDKNKDLKNCLFLNDSISHSFSNIKFQILTDLKQEEINKKKSLKFTYMFDNNTLNNKFYEEVFSLTDNTYTLFQYILLNSKINNKNNDSNTIKKKI